MTKIQMYEKFPRLFNFITGGGEKLKEFHCVHSSMRIYCRHCPWVKDNMSIDCHFTAGDDYRKHIKLEKLKEVLK